MADSSPYAPLADVLAGLSHRLTFLEETGLGYLTLERPYATLSGGEAQRVRLATQLGMGLTGVTYVLDEPSIGLHPLDQQKLIAKLQDLRDSGNSVIVVEHDGETMRAADYLLELGPGAGNQGGRLLFAGTVPECLADRTSATGGFLTGRLAIDRSARRLQPERGFLTVRGAREHNLQNLTVAFPVGLLTVVCGASGSGKSTLVNGILAKALALRLHGARDLPGAHDRLDGIEAFESVVRVDQSPIGRSPRSNPATFTKLFDHLRELYAKCPLSKIRGYTPARFSFNIPGGRCERCRGDGQIKLDMQFMGEVFIDCPSCQGARYNRETLEVRYRGLNIAEALQLTVDDALATFSSIPKIRERLATLQAVGLGYLKLGQPANTLSGGEAQRLKLSLELSKRQQGQTLYLLDEPTTGLHWQDIQRLLDLLFQLRDAGNTVVLIEHHTDVMRLADWLIELGHPLDDVPGHPTAAPQPLSGNPDRGSRLAEAEAAATVPPPTTLPKKASRPKKSAKTAAASALTDHDLQADSAVASADAAASTVDLPDIRGGFLLYAGPPDGILEVANSPTGSALRIENRRHGKSPA